MVAWEEYRDWRLWAFVGASLLAYGILFLILLSVTSRWLFGHWGPAKKGGDRRD